MPNPFQMLLGANGTPYQAQGGLADKMWGQQNISQARFNEVVDRINNMGKPGAGFLNTSKYGQPNSTWDGFHGLMMGMRDGAKATGRNFDMGLSQGLGPAPNTRWDDQQIGVGTGRALGDDAQLAQQELNRNPRPSHQAFANLQRKYGL